MKRARTIPFVFALALVTTSSGCFWVTTKHEGETLRRDVDRIDAKVAKQQETLGSSVTKLETTLEEASKLLARNSADLGTEVDGLVQENARLTGLVMEAKRYADEVKGQMTRYEERVNDLETRLAKLETTGSAAPTKTAATLYEEGSSAFKAGKFEDARQLYRTLVIKYPGDDRADDAQFYRGEAFYREGNFQASLAEFQAVFEKYASSSLADDALFRAGEAAEKLKWCTDARAYFGLLRQKYPKSSLVKKSKQRDNVLRRNGKNKKKCQS